MRKFKYLGEQPYPKDYTGITLSSNIDALGLDVGGIYDCLEYVKYDAPTIDSICLDITVSSGKYFKYWFDVIHFEEVIDTMPLLNDEVMVGWPSREEVWSQVKHFRIWPEDDWQESASGKYDFNLWTSYEGPRFLASVYRVFGGSPDTNEYVTYDFTGELNSA